MTAVVSEPAAAPSGSAAMPGWNLAADLTPPELLASRQLRVLRRVIAVALVAILLGCAGMFVYAMQQSSAAADDASAAKDETRSLTIASTKFSNTTQLQAASQQIRSQLATALQSDVDFGSLTAKVRRALPPTMSIQNLTISFTNPDATAAAAGVTGPIGSATVTGSARSLNDLPAFVDALGKVRGVVNVVPTTNQRSGKFVQFTLTFDLSDALYSHHFDTGGK